MTDEKVVAAFVVTLLVCWLTCMRYGRYMSAVKKGREVRKCKQLEIWGRGIKQENKNRQYEYRWASEKVAAPVTQYSPIFFDIVCILMEPYADHFPLVDVLAQPLTWAAVVPEATGKESPVMTTTEPDMTERIVTETGMV